MYLHLSIVVILYRCDNLQFNYYLEIVYKVCKKRLYALFVNVYFRIIKSIEDVSQHLTKAGVFIVPLVNAAAHF